MIKINRSVKIVLAVIAILLLAAVFIFGILKDDSGSGFDEFGSSPTYDSNNKTIVTVDGVDYKKNDAISAVLFIGVDNFGVVKDSGFHFNQGQADFLMLVLFDRENETYKLLHINRDTMTDVDMLGLGGKYAGTDVMQIALSHCYGGGLQDSCVNTVKAVSELLCGIKIDSYFAMNMDGVSLLNDEIGGVTLVVLDDFKDGTGFKKGEEVTLMGSEALSYVRSRMSVGDGTNVSRMERQRQYISSFLNQLGEKASSASFIDKAITLVSDYSVTDMTITQLSTIADAFSDYSFSGIETIAGEIGTDGRYIQFYPDKEKLQSQIIGLLYFPVDK